MTRPNPDYDVVIVGARCAGAATARLLALSGARVLVVDRAPFGSDTLSTSYLMRGAVLQLRRWGLLERLVEAGTPVVRSTHFHYAHESVEVPLRASDGVPGLMAPRRTVLDPLLVQAAREAGAEFRFGARVQGLLRRTDGRVVGIRLQERGGAQTVRASTVVGADGMPSAVARWVDAPRYRVAGRGAPSIYGFYAGIEVDAYHWFYAHGMAGGMAPTNEGLTTLFVGAPPERFPELFGDREAGVRRIARELSAQFAQQLSGGRRIGGLRVFPGTHGYYRTPWGPGWALVGDAGYFRDPNTAHGISDAFRDAELLARALVAGTEGALQDYHVTRDRVSGRLFEASDRLAGGWDQDEVERLLLEASAGMRESLELVRTFDDPARSTLPYSPPAASVG